MGTRTKRIEFCHSDSGTMLALVQSSHVRLTYNTIDYF